MRGVDLAGVVGAPDVASFGLVVLVADNDGIGLVGHGCRLSGQVAVPHVEIEVRLFEAEGVLLTANWWQNLELLIVDEVEVSLKDFASVNQVNLTLDFDQCLRLGLTTLLRGGNYTERSDNRSGTLDQLGHFFLLRLHFFLLLFPDGSLSQGQFLAVGREAISITL